MSEDEIIYRVSPPVRNEELDDLFFNAWQNHKPTDFRPVLDKSLAYICAYHQERLIGFVYLAWDGGIHAFVLNTTVHTEFRRRGVGLQLIRVATETAKKRGLTCVHVDYEPHLETFYHKCGFRDTKAGLINLKAS